MRKYAAPIFVILLFAGAMLASFAGHAAESETNSPAVPLSERLRETMAADFATNRQNFETLAGYPPVPLALSETGGLPELPPELSALLQTAADPVSRLIQTQAVSHPWILALLAVFGLFRAFVHPFFAAWHAWAVRSGKPQNVAFVERVQNSLALRVLLFGVDWLTSVKVVRP